VNTRFPNGVGKLIAFSYPNTTEYDLTYELAMEEVANKESNDRPTLFSDPLKEGMGEGDAEKYIKLAQDADLHLKEKTPELKLLMNFIVSINIIVQLINLNLKINFLF
jgi:hypothetical protein